MRSIVMALFVVTAITASCTATMKEDKATEPTTEVGTGQSDETMKIVKIGYTDTPFDCLYL